MKEYFKNTFSIPFHIWQNIWILIINSVLLSVLITDFNYRILGMTMLINFLYFLFYYIDYKYNKYNDL